MKSLAEIRRMRSIYQMDREIKLRENLIGYDLLRLGKPCDCDECQKLREEIATIKSLIEAKPKPPNMLAEWSDIILKGMNRGQNDAEVS